MKVMRLDNFLLTVTHMEPRTRFVYFVGAFAYHKEIHSKTPLGQRMTALSELALWLEEEKQVLLAAIRKDMFLYDYVVIKCMSPPPMSEFLTNAVKEAQDEFDSYHGLQGLGKIRSREKVNTYRIH